MSKQLLRSAIIGCGVIGSSMQDKQDADRRGVCTHAAAYSGHPQVKLAAFCDTNKTNLQNAVNRWGEYASYQDYQTMLDEQQPQLVSVATHVDSHYEITKACLLHDSVRGVLLEKPVSNNLHEGQELLEIARDNKKVLTVNYTRRFPPIFQKLATDIRNKKWGEPISVSGFYTKGLIHNGTHWLDLFRMMFGEPNHVKAISSLPDSEQQDPMLSFEMSSQTVSRVGVQVLPVSAHTIFEMDVLFSNGRIRFIDQTDTIEIHTVKENHPFQGYRALYLSETHENCLRDFLAYAVDDLVASVNGTFESVSPISNAMRNIELATQIIESQAE